MRNKYLQTLLERSIGQLHCPYLWTAASMAMAVLPAPSAAFMSAFLPVARLRLFGQSQRAWSQPLRHRWQPIRLQISNILPAALAPIPIVLGELWDGLLQAVPKKKTTHSKTRSRQMAGKALKDVTALNKCPACGRVKRAHLLCPYCVQSTCNPYALMTWIDIYLDSFRCVRTSHN